MNLIHRILFLMSVCAAVPVDVRAEGDSPQEVKPWSVAKIKKQILTDYDDYERGWEMLIPIQPDPRLLEYEGRGDVKTALVELIREGVAGQYQPQGDEGVV